MTVQDSIPLAELEPLAPLTPPTQRRRRAGPWHVRVWENIAVSLPAVLMALLAAATWWLVKNTPVPDPERPSAPPRHVPDYEMQKFSMQRFLADGAPSAKVEGEALRHYPDTDTLEIDDVRLRAVDPKGLVSTASAKRALANGDMSEVQLIGAARVLREPPPGAPSGEAFEFRGEFLHLFTDTERVRSHLPVTIISGRSEIRADSLEYDHLTQTAVLTGRVKGSIAPQAAAPKEAAP
ncbi:LPS export ABC transporter periplasmic protein LptC [Methylibium rhizosphaerae]|uniref:LPS export ABC transporter periplasmic protein LptC n=1 Tax=Methylibium rhizosphaerae TaxID=2570323 RepID=UPI00112B9A04|nr:LPS export ABC transporter periplasmic protein LptC [Methylibium rhizosphaerae]